MTAGGPARASTTACTPETWTSSRRPGWTRASWATTELGAEGADRVVEAGAVDVVHGHSSHHPKGLEIHRFRLRSVGPEDVRWLAGTLDRESRKLGTRVDATPEGRLTAEWV